MKLSVYGIKIVRINGNDIYTYNICVKHTPVNVEILERNKVNYTLVRRGLSIKFATTNKGIFDKNLINLGIALKEIAQHKLNQKYLWVDYVENVM